MRKWNIFFHFGYIAHSEASLDFSLLTGVPLGIIILISAIDFTVQAYQVSQLYKLLRADARLREVRHPIP